MILPVAFPPCTPFGVMDNYETLTFAVRFSLDAHLSMSFLSGQRYPFGFANFCDRINN